MATLREAVARNPESAAAYSTISVPHCSAHRHPGGKPRPLSAKPFACSPNSSSIRMNLADALIRQNKLDAAREQLEEAVRIGGRAEDRRCGVVRPR